VGDCDLWVMDHQLQREPRSAIFLAPMRISKHGLLDSGKLDAPGQDGEGKLFVLDRSRTGQGRPPIELVGGGKEGRQRVPQHGQLLVGLERWILPIFSSSQPGQTPGILPIFLDPPGRAKLQNRVPCIPANRHHQDLCPTLSCNLARSTHC
jgi:hypothetical protein